MIFGGDLYKGLKPAYDKVGYRVEGNYRDYQSGEAGGRKAVEDLRERERRAGIGRGFTGDLINFDDTLPRYEAPHRPARNHNPNTQNDHSRAGNITGYEKAKKAYTNALKIQEIERRHRLGSTFENKAKYPELSDIISMVEGRKVNLLGLCFALIGLIGIAYNRHQRKERERLEKEKLEREKEDLQS